MNLKEIRDDVRSLIIEPTPGFRSDSELNRWINQAHQALGMLYRIETFRQVTVTAGVTFNKLPEDLLVFKGAWTAEGETIPIIPVGSGTELFNKDVEGMTIFRFGDNFAIVAPRPEQQVEFTITIFYDRKPRMLVSDGDVPEIAEPFHRYIVSYAVMRALQKDEDYEAANIYAQEFQEGIRMTMGHKTPVSQDADIILEMVRLGILNAAEAAEWLNIPLKKKVWQRVEVEEKGFALLGAGAISKSDLIKNTEFTDHEKIKERLEHSLEDFVTLPGWKDERRGE